MPSDHANSSKLYVTLLTYKVGVRLVDIAEIDLYFYTAHAAHYVLVAHYNLYIPNLRRISNPLTKANFPISLQVAF